VETLVLSPSESKVIEPLLNRDDVGAGAFEPHWGFADPNATLYGFAAAAQAHGAVILTQTPALRILTQGDRIVAVDTAKGSIATETVVLAGGAWANKLLRPLGVDLGMKPRRIQVAVFRWPAEIGRRHRVIIDAINHSWLRPEGVNSTIIGVERDGGTDEPEGYDQTPSAEYIEQARRALANRLPIFEHATMRGGWAGMVMSSPDDHPLIGAIDSVPGLFVVAGDNGSSFKTSPAIGICLAELMTESEAKLVDLTPFRPGRITAGQLWHDAHAYARGVVSTVSR
jgi:sarcosine oxidase subunit beta